MSVINQVLFNLERRNASLSELGALPDYVQLPPEIARKRRLGWIAAGVALAVAAPTGWLAFNAMVAEPTQSPVAGGSLAAWPDERNLVYLEEIGVFRLSLELSSLPLDSAGAPKVAAATKAPLSSARLLARKGAESAPDEKRSKAAAPGRSPNAPKEAAGTQDSSGSAQLARNTGTESAPDQKGSKTAAAGPSTAGTGAARTKPALKVMATPPEIRKQVREPSPRELADHQYRKAVALLDQDRPAEAETGLREALDIYPENHPARQVLVGLLVQNRRLQEAERVLEGGVKLAPTQTGFNLTLARLQAHRGDNALAIGTLRSGLEHAHGSAEYAAFLAALLQREGKHEEAIGHFRTALRIRPNFGVWWVGLGISLQAANQPEAALDAYRRARAAGNLHPHVAALADERLKQLQ